jgi:hypothetical protein
MRRLTHLIVLGAFIFSCGGHWYVLQGIAWINMIHQYSQFVPLSEAVSMTLSGKYPCRICQAIAEKKQSENNQLLPLDKYEKKFFPPVVMAAAGPSVAALEYPTISERLSTRSEAPPTPPPRSLAG